MRRLLIFPGSTYVAREIVDSLSSLPDYMLFGAGHDLEFSWLSLYQDYGFLPSLEDPSFEERFLELLDCFSITHVMPANESAILELHGLMSNTHIQFVSHPRETAIFACSKRKTLELFWDSPIFPRSFSPKNMPTSFPVFFKPDFGHSSIGIGLFETERDFEAGISENFDWDKNVVTDFLPGREVTVDCFSTLDKGLLFSRGRLRKVVEKGVSQHTVDFLDDSFSQIGKVINHKLRFNGAWFFQAKESRSGEFKVLEIGARIAGASGLRRGQGVNLSHLSVLASEGLELELVSSMTPNEATFSDGSISFRGEEFFSRLYVDLDDTLILNNEINPPVLSLVKTAIDAGISPAVITRANYNPYDRITGLGLRHFFGEIIHIQDEAPKESFIPRGQYSILIDDSFRERKACSSRPEILAVDASASLGLRGLLRGDG